MTMILKRSVFLLVMVLFAPLVAHSEVTGGGWITGADGGRATFNVDICCTDSPTHTGTFTYHDKEFRSSDFPNGVNIQGTVQSTGMAPGVISASGPYTAAQGGTSGFLRATFIDSGQKGPQKGDSLQVSLFSDEFQTVALYTNASVLGGGRNGGGNITVTGAGIKSLMVFSTLLAGWILWRRRGAVVRARH